MSFTRRLPASLSEDKPNQYLLTTEQRHALWGNEMAMFVVLGMPLVVAAFWSGSTVEVVDILGRVTAPASFGRGVGLAFFVALCVIVGGALWLFVQPADERVDHAKPIRNPRRFSFAAFDGLLIALITSQSLPSDLISGVVSVALGAIAAVIAYVAMLSMVDIPPGPESVDARQARVRGSGL